MEMSARRSNYSLLSQIPDDHFSGGGGGSAGTTTAPSSSGDGKTNRSKFDNRAFDWDLVADQRNNNNNRIGSLYPSIGLQRQSSGSSYGESSLSGGGGVGDFYAPTLSTAAESDIDGFGYFHDDGFRVSELRARFPEALEMTAGGGGGSSEKSWAQQAEESYQLQLALALRLSSDATCADDPNFLEPAPEESALRSSSSSPEAVSRRFWEDKTMVDGDKFCGQNFRS